MQSEEKIVGNKALNFLRTRLLTIPRFDLFLQGALLVVVLLQHNVYLLLRRDAGTGVNQAFIEDWVYIGTGVAEFIFGTGVAWVGRGRRPLAVTAWLGASGASALLVLAFPFAEESPHTVELCGGNVISAYTETVDSDDPNAIPRMIFLIITATLCSLAMISIWAHGLTYLDDHEPHNGPYFYGILISIRLSLGLSGKNWLQAGAVRDDWWEAHVSLAMLVLMFAMLFTLFPKQMPTWKEVEVTDDTRFLPSLGRVLRNKPVMIQSIGLALLNAALFSFVNYDASFVQARFQIESVRPDMRTSRTISDIFRPMVIIFFVMIFRVRFSVRRSDGVKSNTASRVGGVVAIFVAIFFAVIAGLPCDKSAVDGFASGTFDEPQCSQHCNCHSARYGFTPVCSVDTTDTADTVATFTSFSPCLAGCEDYRYLNGYLLFQNCSCGTDWAMRGSCDLPSCNTSYIFYQLFFSVVVATSAASLLMQGMVLLRAVKRYDKPIAIGAVFALVSLLSHGPGHLLYMLISHLTCAYEGIEGGSCVFHRPNIWIMAVVSTGLILCSGIVSIIASRYKNPTAEKSDHDDDDDEDDNNS